MSDHLPAVCCRDHAAVAALDVIRENGDARVTAALDALAAKVEGLVMGRGTATFGPEGTTYFGDVWAYRAAVLDLIAEARR